MAAARLGRLRVRGEPQAQVERGDHENAGSALAHPHPEAMDQVMVNLNAWLVDYLPRPSDKTIPQGIPSFAGSMALVLHHGSRKFDENSINDQRRRGGTPETRRELMESS